MIYYNRMRMTNAEQHELLRKIIHWQVLPPAPPLRVFFKAPAGCGKMFVTSRLPWTSLQPVQRTTGNNTAYNAFVIWRKHRKGGCGSGRNHGCTRLSSSLGRPPPPQGRRASAPAS
ncbi:hypothetical protein HPB48_021066 [Haemaphysalis longicornis]|uniref:Uncharacterized protein n=1 Tax=Haemaphysalis longicornis TaxID=44386 RepID=A0A9J6FHM6_HAELO|nr:hypothetical protein HPB48_021066 [Haemaphysalis longicornis]